MTTVHRPDPLSAGGSFDGWRLKRPQNKWPPVRARIDQQAYLLLIVLNHVRQPNCLFQATDMDENWRELMKAIRDEPLPSPNLDGEEARPAAPTVH
jgi:hypothetical protein